MLEGTPTLAFSKEMSGFIGFIGILFCFSTFFTPLMAYAIIKKYNWSGVTKLTIGALIAITLSFIHFIIGIAIIFRNGFV
jgi:hypothetical protein